MIRGNGRELFVLVGYIYRWIGGGSCAWHNMARRNTEAYFMLDGFNLRGTG